MAASPSKEDVAAYQAALGAAYAAIDAAKTDVDFALDDVETARDEARSIYGTSDATSAFNGAIADLHLAARAIADARNNLPSLDENDVDKA
jgi:hypothetical protein